MKKQFLFKMKPITKKAIIVYGIISAIITVLGIVIYFIIKFVEGAIK